MTDLLQADSRPFPAVSAISISTGIPPGCFSAEVPSLSAANPASQIFCFGHRLGVFHFHQDPRLANSSNLRVGEPHVPDQLAVFS